MISYVPEEKKQKWIKTSDFARKYIPVWERCSFQINPKSIHNRLQDFIEEEDRKRGKNTFVYKAGALEKVYIDYTKKFFRCPPDSSLKTFFPLEEEDKLSGSYLSTSYPSAEKILWGLICQEVPKLMISLNEKPSLYYPDIYYWKKTFPLPVGVSYLNLYYQDSQQSNIIWNTKNYVPLQFDTGIDRDLLLSIPTMTYHKFFNFMNPIIIDTLKELLATDSIRLYFQPTEDFKILNILISREDLKIYCEHIEKHFKKNLEAFCFFNPSQKKEDYPELNLNEEKPEKFQVTEITEEEPKHIDSFDELVNSMEKHISELIMYKSEAEEAKKELNLLTNRVNELESTIKELQFSLNEIQKIVPKKPKEITLFGFKIKKKTIANSGLDEIEF